MNFSQTQIKSLINKIKKYLNDQDLTKGEFYFFLASFMMYFMKPLVDEEWNTFPYKIKNKIISVENGLFLTDEEKNDNFKFVDKKVLFNILLKTKEYLLLQYPNLYDSINNRSYVIIKHNKEFMSFPKNMFSSKKIKIPTIFKTTKQNFIEIQNKKTLNEQVEKEIEKLEHHIDHCSMCKNKKTGKKKLPFKSLHKHQTMYFCSLNCLNNWKL